MIAHTTSSINIDQNLSRSGNVCFIHEITILHKLISSLSSKVEEFQRKNDDTNNKISVLSKIIVRFDEASTKINTEIKNQNEEQENSIKKMKDLFLQMADENDALNHDLKIMHETTQHTNDHMCEMDEKLNSLIHKTVPLGIPVLEENINSNRSSFTQSENSSTNSPLTKKQKISKKKHEYRKKKKLEERITNAKERWAKENGYTISAGMGFI
tara:strand:- start:1033 stop:1671 length:639 start_codon:yes stop_codon:yes gene_type:complete